MKVYYTSSPKLRLEFDAVDEKDIFEKISRIQELLEEQECGACKSKDVAFSHRTVEGNSFYSVKCRACHAELTFGIQKASKALFPKKKFDNGEWIPNKGWLKWQEREEMKEKIESEKKQQKKKA